MRSGDESNLYLFSVLLFDFGVAVVLVVSLIRYSINYFSKKKVEAVQREKDEDDFRRWCRYEAAKEHNGGRSALRAEYERRGIPWSNNILLEIEQLGSGETPIPRNWKGRKS